MELLPEEVVITKKKYKALLEDGKFLYALQISGVDNWIGYDDALDVLGELLGEEENVK